MPLLTIIIPTFNRSEYVSSSLVWIARSLETIRAKWGQSAPSVSIIVGDNCSTDDTVEALKRFSCANYHWYSNSSNLGITKNILRAISLADGEFIWILGDDDYCSCSLIENILMFLLCKNSQVDYLKLNYKQFVNIDEVAFDQSFDFSRVTLDEIVDNSNLLDLDLCFGFISANVYNAKKLRCAIQYYEGEIGLEMNSYFNKLLTYTVLVTGDFLYSLNSLHLGQRVTNGSHFSDGIDTRVKVFIYDNCQVAKNVAKLSYPLYRRLNSIYCRMSWYDIYQIKMNKDFASTEIFNIFRAFGYRDSPYFIFMIIFPRGAVGALATVYWMAKRVLRAIGLIGGGAV